VQLEKTSGLLSAVHSTCVIKCRCTFGT